MAEDDEKLVTAFIMVSGQEIIFRGIKSGNFADLYDVPKLALASMGELANMPGHIIGDPYVVTAPEPHMGKAWRLEPWPRIRRKGTCEEFFVKDRDVMFQLMTTEIDEDLLALYDQVLTGARWVDPDPFHQRGVHDEPDS